jgi:hypothetical protein
MNCDVCGRAVQEDEMIYLEARWVCAACKPAFIQQLREGCLLSAAPSLPDGFQERPLGFGELTSLSWALVRLDWLPIGMLTLLVAVPINLAVLVTEPGDEASWREFGRHFRTIQLLEIVIGVLAALGIAKIVSERLEGRSTGLRGALLHAFQRWLPGIWTGLLGLIIAGLLLLALIVPGVIWMGYYSFASAVTSLRDCGGKRALDYSKSLVRGRWWAVVWRLLALSGLAMIPIVAIEVAVAFAPTSAGLSLVTYVLTDLFFAFVSVGATVLFLNLEAIQRRSPAPVGPPASP